MNEHENEGAQDLEQRGRGARADASHRRFSSFLRRCRQERKLSLRQVERLSESYPDRISNSYLAYCETGRLLPSLGKLITLSKVLGVPMQSFTERLEIDREVSGLPALPAGAVTLEVLRDAGIRRAEAGELRAAYACFEKALEVARDEAPRCDLLMDMAIVLKRMSRHFTARDLLEEVVSLKDLDAARVDRALILLADVLREMGRLPMAAMIGREAMHRASRLGDRAKEAHAACLVGNALYDMGNLDEARPLYESAVRYFREARALPSLVCTLANLANCLVHDPSGARGAEGIRLLHEAEAVARREGFNRQVADILGYLAQAYARQGHAARAEKLHYQSNQIARAGQYHDILFANHWHLRELAVKQGRHAEAGNHLKTLRYLRPRVDNTNAEIQAFDRLTQPAGDAPEDGDGPEVKA